MGRPDSKDLIAAVAKDRSRLARNQIITCYRDLNAFENAHVQDVHRVLLCNDKKIEKNGSTTFWLLNLNFEPLIFLTLEHDGFEDPMSLIVPLAAGEHVMCCDVMCCAVLCRAVPCLFAAGWNPPSITQRWSTRYWHHSHVMMISSSHVLGNPKRHAHDGLDRACL